MKPATKACESIGPRLVDVPPHVIEERAHLIETLIGNLTTWRAIVDNGHYTACDGSFQPCNVRLIPECHLPSMITLSRGRQRSNRSLIARAGMLPSKRGEERLLLSLGPRKAGQKLSAVAPCHRGSLQLLWNRCGLATLRSSSRRALPRPSSDRAVALLEEIPVGRQLSTLTVQPGGHGEVLRRGTGLIRVRRAQSSTK